MRIVGGGAFGGKCGAGYVCFARNDKFGADVLQGIFSIELGRKFPTDRLWYCCFTHGELQSHVEEVEMMKMG